MVAKAIRLNKLLEFFALPITDEFLARFIEGATDVFNDVEDQL
jgi:hypothetical protein